MPWLRRTISMASNVTCGSFDVLARFESCQPSVSLFLSQVQAGGLIVAPSRECSLTKLVPDRSLLKSFVHGRRPQSRRGVPRRSTNPVTPKSPINANAMTK